MTEFTVADIVTRLKADLTQFTQAFAEAQQRLGALSQATGAFRELAREAEDILTRLRQTVRTLNTLKHRGTLRPFERLEAESEVQRYTEKLAALIGVHEAEALSTDGSRTPSWRL